MLKIILLLIIIYLLFIYTKTRKSMEKFKGYRYCHRGFYNKDEIPENSIPAFLRAVESGYGSEFDVHLLKDGNLAIIHDSNLERMTGQKLIVEELTTEQLKDCKLNNTDYTIPTFKEILDIYQGKQPIIIELKYHHNTKELCDEVMRQLKDYKGLYCVECFYPEVVAYMRKHYPEVLRGQLTFNYFKGGNHPFPISFALQFLLFNFWTKPDFIAYEVSARRNLSNRILTKLFKVMEVSWTIQSQEKLDEIEADGAIGIFEGFQPKK